MNVIRPLTQVNRTVPSVTIPSSTSTSMNTPVNTPENAKTEKTSIKQLLPFMNTITINHNNNINNNSQINIENNENNPIKTFENEIKFNETNEIETNNNNKTGIITELSNEIIDSSNWIINYLDNRINHLNNNTMNIMLPEIMLSHAGTSSADCFMRQLIEDNNYYSMNANNNNNQNKLLNEKHEILMNDYNTFIETIVNKTNTKYLSIN